MSQGIFLGVEWVSETKDDTDFFRQHIILIISLIEHYISACIPAMPMRDLYH